MSDDAIDETEPIPPEIVNETQLHAQEVVERASKLLTRTERIKRWGILYIAVLMTVALPLLGVVVAKQFTTVSAIRQTQVQNTGISKNTNLTAHQVKQIFSQFEDCIKPTGTCYRQGQKRTASALVGLEHVILASATCAALPSLPHDPHARQTVVSMCVAHLLNTGGTDGGQGN